MRKMNARTRSGAKSDIANKSDPPAAVTLPLVDPAASVGLRPLDQNQSSTKGKPGLRTGGKMPGPRPGDGPPDRPPGGAFSPKTVFAAIAIGAFAYGAGQQVSVWLASGVAVVVAVLVLKHLRGQ
jgi:hypothetical protein